MMTPGHAKSVPLFRGRGEGLVGRMATTVEILKSIVTSRPSAPVD